MGVSLRAAINAKCKSCTYDPLAGMGTWRQQTEACTVKACPLWHVRPLSDKRSRIDSEDDDREDLSMWCAPGESVSQMLERECEKEHN